MDFIKIFFKSSQDPVLPTATTIQRKPTYTLPSDYHPKSVVRQIEHWQIAELVVGLRRDGETVLYYHPERKEVFTEPDHIRDWRDGNDISWMNLHDEKGAQECISPESHPRILRYLGQEPEPESGGLIFEYLPTGNIRDFLDKHGPHARLAHSSAHPRLLQYRWALQLASALAFIHSRNVFHGTLKCRKVWLRRDISLALADFTGTTFGGNQYPGSMGQDYEYQLPHSGNDPLSVKIDLFAYASTLYEMMTGKAPYADLGVYKNPNNDSMRFHCQDLFERKEFPNLEGVTAGEVILRCWMEEYERSEDVLEDLRRIMEAEGIRIADGGDDVEGLDDSVFHLAALKE